MKSFRLFIIVIVVLLCDTHLVRAQNNLSLEDCIRIAKENNYQVKQAENNLVIAEVGYTTSKMRFLPNVNASISINKGLGNTVDNFTQTIARNPLMGQPNIGSSVTLFKGLSNWNNLKSSQYNVAASEYGIEAMEYNVTLSVLQAYFQVLFDQENLKVEESRLTLLEKQLTRVENQLKAGMLTQGDVYNVKSQVASERVAIVNQQNSLNRNMLSLIQTLNVDPKKQYTLLTPNLDGINLEGLVPRTSAVYDYASENLPEILQTEMSLLSSEYQLRTTKAATLPTINFSIGAGSFYSSNSQNFLGLDSLSDPPRALYGPADPLYDQLWNNRSASLGLSMNIPIFNNWSSRSSYMNAKINLENARLDYERQKLDLYQRIQLAEQDAVAAQMKYEATLEQLLSLTESFTYAQAKYESGVMDFYSYTEILNNKSNAEFQLIQAKYDFIFKTKILDLYLGKEITF